MTELLKLNLGSSLYHFDGWVSVDLVEDFKPEYVADVTTLDIFEDNSAAEVYAGHIFEHLHDPMTALLNWRRVLVPGGKLYITVPDPVKAGELWIAGEAFEGLTTNPLLGVLGVTVGFMGRSHYESYDSNPVAQAAQIHQRAVDRPILAALMHYAGFDEITEVTSHPAMPGQVNWQYCLSGVKPNEE